MKGCFDDLARFSARGQAANKGDADLATLFNGHTRITHPQIRIVAVENVEAFWRACFATRWIADVRHFIAALGGAGEDTWLATPVGATGLSAVAK